MSKLQAGAMEMNWKVEISREGMEPFPWKAKIYLNGQYMKSFDALTIGRATKKAQRYISKYANYTLEIK